MKNVLIINDVIVKENRIEYRYEVHGEFEKYFCEESNFILEYDINVSKVPKSVAVIPFISNVLPIIWLCDGEIIVEELDKDFYNNIDKIKKGYEDMYPMLGFGGKLTVKVIKENVVESSKLSATFFSGGVDAYATLFRHLEEKPILMTLWGADVKLEDKVSWNNVENHIKLVAKDFQLEYCKIKSEFRLFLNENLLDKLVKDSNDGWWHGFQHGIGLIGHAAPISYVYGLKNVYIASSFCSTMKGKYTCASDPTIDNYMYYCGCKTIHDGYELTRQEKVREIVNYRINNNVPVNLRVCWQSTGGGNCCECEKCYRTILEIISEGGDPLEFGFKWSDNDAKRCKINMKYKITEQQSFIDTFYLPIQQNLVKNEDKIMNFNNYKWIVDMDFSKFNDNKIKTFRRSLFCRGIKKIIKSLSR